MIFTQRDAARLATEAMHDRMDRKQERQRFYDAYSQGQGATYKAIRPPDHTQIPPLTLEAAKTRLSELSEQAVAFSFGEDVPNPSLFSEEKARLLDFIAHKPATPDQPPTAP